MPVAETIIPEIQKIPITREVDHGRSINWGRSTTTIDDCAAKEEDAAAVGECG
jgi:hypothetical protein